MLNIQENDFKPDADIPHEQIYFFDHLFTGQRKQVRKTTGNAHIKHEHILYIATQTTTYS